MKTLVLLGLVGLAAQLVDGSLGMAYGVTTTTLLLAIGSNPAAASATVHLAEIGTTLISGLSHWKFGNVDVYILVRFTILGLPKGNLGKPLRERFLGPLGLVAGFVDATGGGGWGPVGTPAILASGRLEPRKVIGSIDTSEFLVALTASLGFLFSLGSQGVNFQWVAAILVGGVIAAPIAAWLVRHIPPRPMPAPRRLPLSRLA